MLKGKIRFCVFLLLAINAAVFAVLPNRVSYELQPKQPAFQETAKVDFKVVSVENKTIEKTASVKVTAAQGVLLSKEGEVWEDDVVVSAEKGVGSFYVKTQSVFQSPLSYFVTIFPSTKFSASGVKFPIQFQPIKKGIASVPGERVFQHPIKVTDAKGIVQTKMVKIKVNRP